MTNTALIQQLYDALNRRDFPAFDALLAPDCVHHGLPAQAEGPSLKEAVERFIKAFPDFKVVIVEHIASTNRVATRGYWSGTHQGEFMGVAPTNKTVNINYMDFWFIENGKAREHWVLVDYLGWQQQLGAAPVQTP